MKSTRTITDYGVEATHLAPTFFEPKCRVKPQGGGHDQNVGLDSATSSS